MMAIIQSPYMESMANKIVTHKHAQFKEVLTRKLMDTVVLGVISHTKTQLNKECMNDITARQKEQEALNENLGEIFR